MSEASDSNRTARGADERDEHDMHPESLHPEGLHPEGLAAGVDDVLEVFDREPPERPVTDAEAQPPFG